AVADGRRARAGGVAARARLGEPPGAELLAAGKPGQPALLLDFSAEHPDVGGAEAVVRGDREGDGRIDARELFDADAVVDRRHAGAAVFLGELNPHQAQRGHLRNQLCGKMLGVVPLADVRLDLSLGELANGLTEELLFVGETEVHECSGREYHIIGPVGRWRPGKDLTDRMRSLRLAALSLVVL